MNPLKEHKREVARNLLKKANINFISLNNDMHWKVGHINFYPTTELWQSDNIGGDKGKGIDSLLRFLKHKVVVENHELQRRLSVQEIAKIYLNNKDKSLMEKCEILHKEIYG